MTKPLLHLHSVKRKGAVRVRSLFSLGEEPLSPGTVWHRRGISASGRHMHASLLAWRSHLHCKDRMEGAGRSRHIHHSLAVAVGVGVGIRSRTVQVQDEQQSTVRRGKAGRLSPSPWPAHLAWLGGEVSSSLLEVATTKAARAGPDGHVMGVHTYKRKKERRGRSVMSLHRRRVRMMSKAMIGGHGWKLRRLFPPRPGRRQIPFPALPAHCAPAVPACLHCMQSNVQRFPTPTAVRR